MTFHHIILLGERLNVSPSVFHVTFLVFEEVSVLFLNSMSVKSNKIVPTHEGLDKRVCGVELPFMLVFLVADFKDFCFPFAVGSAWVCVPSCCLSSTIEKGVYGTLSRTDFPSVLISSTLTYLIFTLENFGMQTHVRTSYQESTELHLHLLTVVHDHTTVWIILALDKANSSMDIKSWRSVYHAPLWSSFCSIDLRWYFFGSLRYVQICLYLSRCSWNISQKKRSYLQTGLK